uniref:BTB domain-containing protein n=1 Tax=Panagrolaimus davidi TaxID=227884 RepID=A0A914QEA5_9BILA
MSSNVVLTEVVTIKKLFKWTINNFNKLDASSMSQETVKVGRYGSRTIYFVESPRMTAIDPYDGRKYTATFKLTFDEIHGNFSVASRTFKPFLIASSLFFKDMFESTIQNFVEITDFRYEVLQKMVEFCETDDIKEVKGYECELFKAAHKYQMNDLMEFSVEKMSENASSSNIFSYLQLAKTYNLKDFEEWCMQFAFRTNFNV